MMPTQRSHRAAAMDSSADQSCRRLSNMYFTQISEGCDCESWTLNDFFSIMMVVLVGSGLGKCHVCLCFKTDAKSNKVVNKTCSNSGNYPEFLRGTQCATNNFSKLICTALKINITWNITELLPLWSAKPLGVFVVL